MVMTTSGRSLYFILLALVLTSFLCAASRAGADTNLELIPEELQSVPAPEAGAQPPAAPSPYRIKVFLDEALQGNFYRYSLAVPLPISDFSGFTNRTSLDVRAEVTFCPALSLTVADRLNYFSGPNMFISREGILNDLKETYLTWNMTGSYFIDLGRINVKNGVATGFNPTDYFKKDAVTAMISQDAAVLRENRLGTLMMRAQGIWQWGSLTLIVAPEVPHEQDRWWTDQSGGALQLNRTNDRFRMLAKADINAIQDMNPEVLYFDDDGRSNVGFNLTRGIGDNVVAYAEWNAGQSPDIVSEALQDARNLGMIPSGLPFVIPGNSQIRFRNQLAAGFSYTEKINRTTYLEYQYNEAGLSPSEWNNWFATGETAKGFLGNPKTSAAGKGILAQLWAIREFSQEAQEPLSQHAFFIRSFWQNALVNKLDLTGIFQVNLQDGSLYLQPLAEYRLSNSVTLNLAFDFYLGAKKSDFGSLPQWGDIRAGFRYYF